MHFWPQKSPKIVAKWAGSWHTTHFLYLFLQHSSQNCIKITYDIFHRMNHRNHHRHHTSTLWGYSSHYGIAFHPQCSCGELKHTNNQQWTMDSFCFQHTNLLETNGKWKTILKHDNSAWWMTDNDDRDKAGIATYFWKTEYSNRNPACIITCQTCSNWDTRQKQPKTSWINHHRGWILKV